MCGAKPPLYSSRFRSMTEDYLTPMEPTFEALGPPPISMEQGVRERTRTRMGVMPGTHMGEIASSLMLFKGFSVSMMMKHWARAGTMPTGTDRAQYVARLEKNIGTTINEAAFAQATGANNNN